MTASKIEWTGRVWNPIVGCSVVSPGCTNCYAMRDAWRKGYNPKTPQYHGLTQKVNGKPVWTGDVRLVEHKLTEPLRWRKPDRVFVNSMSDLFHENVPDEWIDRVFAVMALAPQHTFQVLTKRPERMREYMRGVYYRLRGRGADGTYFGMEQADMKMAVSRMQTEWPLRNVWLGVSVEDQQRADERIPLLLDTPAAVRFVSAEPLLGPVDFRHIEFAHWHYPEDKFPKLRAEFWGPEEPVDMDVLKGTYRDGEDMFRHEYDDLSATLDWIIVGGESGPGARPMHPAWVRAIRDQCRAAGTAFFFKQWGEWVPRQGVPTEIALSHDAVNVLPDGRVREWDDNFPEGRLTSPEMSSMIRVGKKRAGALLDGRAHREWPKWPSK